jgi:nitrite reductase (NADH) large subunit
MKKNLVVIGNGMAGARAVEEILARGGNDAFNITMFGDEPYGNYNRILLSNVLNGSQQEEEIFLNPIEWYHDNNITLHVGVYAESILRKSRCVLGADGSIEPYDKLIIATGSRSHVPSIEGVRLPDDSDKPGVFVFRTLDDCREIAEYAKNTRGRAAIIGGGLLGLEAARGLQSYGVQVDVIHRSGHLMNQQLDPQAGVILKSTMEQMSIGVLLGKQTTAVLGDERVTGLRFADGSVLPCDMVVMAAGIKPNAEIAQRCGLQVQRAIVVDNQLRSVTDPDVYVVGECAQHRGNVYGLVAPLWEQAKVLADHITGRNPNAAYHGSKVATKLKVMGVEMAAMGITEPVEERDEIVQFTEPKKGTYKKLIIRDGRLVGGILLGDISKAAYLMQAFDRGTPLPEERLSLLFDIGAPSKKVTVEEMPVDMQVCNCNGVTKGAIMSCVKAGKRSPKAVMESTRAGMGCGSCKSMVTEIIEFACGGELEEDPSVHYYVPGVPLSKPDLIQAIREKGLKSVSAVFLALADGKEDPGSKPGLASLLNTIWAGEYVKESDARFINERVHANIQKDGTFSVVPMMAGGVTSPAELRRIADVAEKYHVPMVKLTGGQRIDLLGIKKDDLPKVWADLGIPSGHAYGKSYRTCKSCVGSDFCRFGVGDSTTLAIKIEHKFKGIDTPHKVKMATAGCPRNCSEAMVKDVGAVAVEGGKWEIYVGGAAGAHVRKGDILCVVDSHDDVLKYSARFMQYYRENAKYLERTYGFVERIGIDKVRAVVVEDSEGIAARLDAAIEASIEAYQDPWMEAYQAARPTEFATLLPVIQ